METKIDTQTLGAQRHLATQKNLLYYLRGNRIHSTILFVGPSDEAKFQIAKGIAKWLLCRNLKQTFCTHCSPCRRIEKEIHPDVFIHQDNTSDVIKIETIRLLCHQMELTPVEGGAKVCLVDECHRMTPAAANAFLKSLEEPGPNRYFLLLTSQPGSLLPTVLSRCIQFYFKPENSSEKGWTQEEPLFQRALTEFLENQNTLAVKPVLGNKAQCTRFLHFLQDNLRQAATNPYLKQLKSGPFLRLPEISALEAFEASVKLEGRLRSNANYALMMEDFLIHYFSKEALT